MKVLALTARSATLSLDNDSAYYSPVMSDVILNGKIVIEKLDVNVFTLFDLEPDRYYTVMCGDEQTEFTTGKETALLNVKDFGAIGDGVRDDSEAFAAAIACAPGGSTIYIPEGEYKLKPVFLKSNITLYLAKSCRIVAETDRTLYPILPAFIKTQDGELNLGCWQGEEAECFASVFTGINCENIAIMGQGEIDGNALNSDWYQDHRVKRTAWRPRGLFFNRCQNILVQGVTVKNTPSWNVHPYFCDDVKLYNLTLENIPSMPTTDGIDPDCCNNVDIAGVRISVGDDCIAIKSGTLQLAKKYQTPCRNITITNCLMERGHGGVVFGSESSGGIENVTVTKCVFDTTERGFRVKTRRGRGRIGEINNVTFDNIIMKNVETPFVVNMYYNMGDESGHDEYIWTAEKLPVDERTPIVGKLEFANMVCSEVGCCAAAFYGLPEEPIKSVKLKNVSFSFNPDCQPAFPDMKEKNEKIKNGGLFFQFVDEVILENVQIAGVSGQEVITDGVKSLTRM